MKILTSITDFSPLLKSPEYIFKKLKELDLDGLEMVMGLKFRFNHEYILRLSKKYSLPILTIHQPIWSGTFFFDESFIKKALLYNVKNLVFHPLPHVRFDSQKAQKYFEKLSLAQEKYGINVMLENLPIYHDTNLYEYIYPLNREYNNMYIMLKIANDYDFSLTFDTSHHNTKNPHDENWFEKAFPKIKDIHLSSFIVKGKQHLPLTMGDFNTKGFIKKLLQKKYSNFLVFEIYYPRLINISSFDILPIKNSLDMVRSSF